MRERNDKSHLTLKQRLKVCGICLCILVVFGFLGALLWQFSGPNFLLQEIGRCYQRGDIRQMLGGVVSLLCLTIAIPIFLLIGLIGFVQGLLGWRTALTNRLVEEQRQTMAQLRQYEAQQNAEFLKLHDPRLTLVEDLKRTLEEGEGVLTPSERQRLESELRKIEKSVAKGKRATYWKRTKWAWITFLGIGPAIILVCFMLTPGGPVVPLRVVPVHWAIVPAFGTGIGLAISLIAMRSLIKSAAHIVVPTWVGLVVLAAVFALVVGIILMVSIFS